MNVFSVTILCIFAAVAVDGNYDKLCKNDLTGKPAAVRLSNDLFCSYNKHVRPVINQSTHINVDTTLHIFNVHMNEQWNILQASIILIMIWKDEFLAWDTSKYENIKYVYEDSTTIWIPNIVSYDIGFDGQDSNKYTSYLPPSKVFVTSDGVVKYNHHITLAAQCSANIEKWPFDSHSCSFFIGNPIYTNMNVNYSFPNGNYDIKFYKPDREWNLSSIEYECINIYYASQNSSIPHCLLEYEIKVVRFSAMYISSVIIPALVISLMSSSTLLMGREISLRIILSCLFFISEFLYLQFLNTKIPNNGEHTVYIVLLYRNSIILTAITLIISTVSNELYKYGTYDDPRNGPEWLKSVQKCLLNTRPINMLSNFPTQETEILLENNAKEDIYNSKKNENSLFWKTLSVLLDRLSFIIILVMSLINFMVFLP